MNAGRKAARILGFVLLWFGILLVMALAIAGTWVRSSRATPRVLMSAWA